jgi:hypothetical protein
MENFYKRVAYLGKTYPVGGSDEVRHIVGGLAFIGAPIVVLGIIVYQVLSAIF